MNNNRNGRKMHSSDMTQVGVICAVLCILSPWAIVLPISPVPISFSLIAIYLSVYLVGYRKALLGCVLYLFLGAIGLPVYAGGMAGIGRLFGPTGGYLFGYLAVIWVFGLLGEGRGKKWMQSGAMVIGLLCLYAIGTVWLMVQTKMTVSAALMAGVVPYIIADILKILFVTVLGDRIRKRLGNGY